MRMRMKTVSKNNKQTGGPKPYNLKHESRINHYFPQGLTWVEWTCECEVHCTMYMQLTDPDQFASSANFLWILYAVKFLQIIDQSNINIHLEMMNFWMKIELKSFFNLFTHLLNSHAWWSWWWFNEIDESGIEAPLMDFLFMKIQPSFDTDAWYGMEDGEHHQWNKNGLQFTVYLGCFGKMCHYTRVIKWWFG